MKKLIVMLLILSVAFATTFYDKCGNDRGWSSNPDEYHCRKSGHIDCCGWRQEYHVHDLGTVVKTPVIHFVYASGSWDGCTSTIGVYVSEDGEQWHLIGKFSTTSKEKPGGGWERFEKSIASQYDCRYIKLEIPICYNDYSEVTVEGEEKIGSAVQNAEEEEKEMQNEEQQTEETMQNEEHGGYITGVISVIKKIIAFIMSPLKHFLVIRI